MRSLRNVLLSLFVLLAMTAAHAGVSPSSRSRTAETFSELDRLNITQNRVRERIGELSSAQQELSMALDNLSLEFQNQMRSEQVQRERLRMLLRVVYRIQKDGLLRFIVTGEDSSRVAGRLRLVLRTLRSHQALGREMASRTKRLLEAESTLGEAKTKSQRLLTELEEQQKVLDDLLERKKELNRKLASQPKALSQEMAKISIQLGSLFSELETHRESEFGTTSSSFKRSLLLPIEQARLLRGFGKQVHSKFKTVTMNNGIEFSADLNAQVRAVTDGIVEYEGWVKGLGNVMVLHHGEGLYSMSAFLHKALQKQGSRVRKGDAIALVGDTGENDFPSLYFELRKNGKPVDPLVYFTSSELKALH